MSADSAFQDARQRRFALHHAMQDVEHAVQAPAKTPAWRSTLFTKLHDLSAALEDHIDTVESAGGIIEQATTRAPRTSGQGERLRNDHPILRAQLHKAITLVQDLGDDVSAGDVEEIRTAVVDLLVSLYRHRQHGSDFVWEAYDVDIGGLG